MAPDKPFHNPFGALGDQLGITPDELAQASAPTPKPALAPPPGVKIVPRAVVRIERTGRGGKEVTVVEQLAIPPGDREKWLKALKASLGCGGVVEGDSLVLQGDHRDRLPAILTSRGVKRVTVAR
jgi:translation initiation factor 1